jgi:hypothetical protein
MGALSSQSAVVVILETQLPYGLPEEHARILGDILCQVGLRVDRRVHTILIPGSGSRDRSRALLAKVCEHYFVETLGPDYDEDQLKMTPFEYPATGTRGVVVSHP